MASEVNKLLAEMEKLKDDTCKFTKSGLESKIMLPLVSWCYVFQLLAIFAKSFSLDVWKGSEYASGSVQFQC